MDDKQTGADFQNPSLFQLVEKIDFAREASFYYPVFALGLPGQKHFYLSKCIGNGCALFLTRAACILSKIKCVRLGKAKPVDLFGGKAPLGDFSTVSRTGIRCGLFILFYISAFPHGLQHLLRPLMREFRGNVRRIRAGRLGDSGKHSTLIVSKL